MHVDVRWQFVPFNSLCPQSASQGLNSGSQTWWQESLPVEPFYQPSNVYFYMFVINSSAVAIWVYLWLFYDQFTCLFLCQYHTVFTKMALEYNLRSSILRPPELFFLLRIALAFQNCISYSIAWQNTWQKQCKEDKVYCSTQFESPSHPGRDSMRQE